MLKLKKNKVNKKSCKFNCTHYMNNTMTMYKNKSYNKSNNKWKSDH